MTIIHIDSVGGDDYLYVEADEDQVQDAVDELTEEYDNIPDEEQESGLAEYILNGLDERGLDTWRAGAIKINDNRW